jgi:hypothetical protein
LREGDGGVWNLMYLMGSSGSNPLTKATVFAWDQWRNVTTDQLRTAGFSSRMINGATARGVLSAVHAGVYAIGPPPSMPYERAMAAVLAGRPTGLLSHEWCRYIFGVGRLPGHDPDVTVTTKRRAKGITFHLTKHAPEPDANHGIPCTRPERMLVDLAPSLSLNALRRLVNDVQIERLTTPERIRQALATHHGRATRALANLVADDRGATRSLLEDLLFDLHTSHGLPLPLLNAAVDGREVDFHYPDRNLVVEADGYSFHRTKVQFEHDREKRLDLEAKGQRVIWISYRQVTELRDQTAAQLLAILS